MRTPERVAREDIEASGRHDQRATADPFHRDAEWLPLAPLLPLQGRAAITERYPTDVKAANAPILEDTCVADDHRCVVEFVVDHPDHGRVPIVDVLDIDASGRVTRLAVYRR